MAVTVTSANKQMSGWLVIVSEVRSVSGADRHVLVGTEDNSVTWPASQSVGQLVLAVLWWSVASQSAMIPRALLSLT